MWRGRGRRGERHGEDIPIAARVARVAGIAALFEVAGGAEVAREAVRRRAGGMLDPGMAADFDALGERGYYNEALDQLLVEVLLGVR